MLVKIYEKLITLCVIGMIATSCAPQYTAHFAQSKHEVTRYEIEDQKPSQPMAFTDAEVQSLKEGIKIKEIIIDADVINEKISSNSGEVIKPQSKEELIIILKDNPDATIAIQMDKKEKKAFKKEIKEQLEEHRESANVMQYNKSESKVLYYILAVLLPPLAVGLWRGIGSDFWINILLTLLFYLPGIIHAIIVISNKPKMTRPATM